MKQILLTGGIFFVMLSILLGACAEDSDGITSIDGEKKISELTADEADQLCVDFASAFNRQITQEKMCMYMAVVAGSEAEFQPKVVCEAAYDGCKEEEPMDFVEMMCSSDDSTDEGENEYSDCDITVDEYETCATDMLAELNSIMSNLSCDSPEAEEITDPPSCAKMSEACPGAMDDI